MEHLDLALNLQQEEAVYSTNDEGGGEMSERVGALAASIYGEFQRIIHKHGSDSVETLMPMVVNVLEQLDSSYNEGNETSVELELLAEDNEQLITQYEREKQLRKLAESKYLEYEDAHEQEKSQLYKQVESLDHTRKQAESKVRQFQDQIERLEERLGEQKKEYGILHQRHTEMLHAYMERMEIQSKMSPSPAYTQEGGFPFKRTSSMERGSFNSMSASQPNLATPGAGDRTRTPSTNYAQMQLSDIVENRNDMSLEDETANKQDNTSDDSIDKPDSSKVSGGKENVSRDLSEDFDNNANISSEGVLNTPMKKLTPLSDTDSPGLSIQAQSCDVSDVENLDVLSLTEAEQSMVVADSDSSYQTVGEATFFSAEARAILESTPELAKNLPMIYSQDVSEISRSFPNNENLSLFAEFQSLQQPNMDDPGLNVEDVGQKEFDLVLKENEQLIDVRNKLQTQKNDLLKRLEELSSDKEIMEEDYLQVQATNEKMKIKISELEQAVKKAHHENDKAQIALKNKTAEERISSANRKRFTRVEMAKVLMERNQYKERLMELQEAVRWTEMIRASKENHMAAMQQKKKSTIWRLFSNLFTGSSGVSTTSSATTSPKKQAASPQQQVNVWYGNQSAPISRRHSAIVTPVGSGSPGTAPKYNPDTSFEGLTERQRQERKERYKTVKEHINSENRKQAYGWSLPAHYVGDQSGALSVPVPVYCRPLLTDPAMKIWCAAGVNLDGGRTSEGNYVGLPATFKEPSRSTVWIGTSTHSCSKITILDANNPSQALDQFIVSSSHLLCMAAVAGLSQNDYGVNSDSVDGPKQGTVSPNGAISHSSRQSSPEHNSSVTGIQTEEESFPEDETDGSITVNSVLPTMWLGAQSGKVYIHSVIANWKKCLQSAKLKDSLLSIVHTHGRVLAALADGTVAIFHRKPDGRWDLSNYHLLDLGRPHHSIRCMAVVHDFVWCGYRNKIQVINPRSMRIEKSFDAHPRRESQVRQLACIGDGVWVSIRLDSTLRLYNAHTFHHLQDVDIEPYVSKMLGTGKFGFSFVRITALMLTTDRLWVGTGNGVILSVPLVSSQPSRETDSEQSKQTVPVEDTTRSRASSGSNLFMPYCAMVNAQLSFHGHRDSAKFFIVVPGSAANVDAAKAYTMAGAPPPSPSSVSPANNPPDDESFLVMSGGEGYIDFRIGDEEGDESKQTSEVPAPVTPKVVSTERSYLLVWQVANSKDAS